MERRGVTQILDDAAARALVRRDAPGRTPRAVPPTTAARRRDERRQLRSIEGSVRGLESAVAGLVEELHVATASYAVAMAEIRKELAGGEGCAGVSARSAPLTPP